MSVAINNEKMVNTRRMESIGSPTTRPHRTRVCHCIPLDTTPNSTLKRTMYFFKYNLLIYVHLFSIIFLIIPCMLYFYLLYYIFDAL